MRGTRGPELVAARDAVQAILEDVCARAGHAVPALRIVGSLRGGVTDTAQATVKGAGSILVPASLALFLTQSLNRAAVENLMAHELGHIVFRRSGWARASSWLRVAFFALCAAPLVIPVAAQTGDPWLRVVLCTLLLVVPSTLLLVWAFAKRKHESECDIFAVRLQGHLNGATELMHDYERRRRERGQGRPGLLRLLHAHPDPMRRLSIMCDALGATSTHEGGRTIRG